MKMLRRVAAVVTLLVAGVAAVQADDITNLYIHTKTGEKIVLRFVDRPTISFNPANALIIKSATTTTAVKGFALIDKITFDKASGISDAMTDTDGEIRPTGVRTVSLVGFKAGTRVTVCSVNGQVLRSFATEGEDVTDISLEAYGSGVYIISAGETVCKIAI